MKLSLSFPQNAFQFLMILLVTAAGFSPVWLSARDVQKTENTPSLQSTVVHADIYRDSALVTRKTSANLAMGENRLQFQGLPNRLLPNSIQLSMKEGLPVVLKDVFFDIEELDSEPDELKALDDSIREKEIFINSLQKQIDLIDDEMKFARNLARYFSEHYVKDKDSAATNVEQAAETWEFVQKTISDSNRKKADLTRALEDMLKELKELKKEREKAFDKLRQKRGRVEIVLEASQVMQAELFLSYLLQDCRWQPTYELRADMQNLSLELGYFAYVQQNSFEDWNDITLSLFTSSAQNMGNVPTLHPIYLNPVYADNRRLRTMVSKAEYSMVDSAMESEPAPPVAEVTRGMTSFQATVPGKVKIPADNKRVKLPVLSEKLSVTFWTEFVPAVNDRGYLVAEMTNELELPVLPGRSLVFIDDKLTAQVNLDYYPPEETMKLSLGVDEQIQMKRRIGKQLEVQSGLIDKTTTLRRQYFTEITSYHLKPHTVKVKEQYPISQNEKIEVKRIIPRNKEAEFEEDNGIFVRTMEIQPKEKSTLETRFEVSFPRDWNIPQDF